MPPGTAPSIDNIFGAAAPVAGGAPSLSAGPSLANIFGNTSAPIKSPSVAAIPLSVATTPTPPDTSSMFSKFTGFLGNTVGKVSKAISDATTAPDQKTLGTDPTTNMMRFLPSELARTIPGVAQLQDDTTTQVGLTKMGAGDILPIAGNAAKITVQGLAGTPVRIAATVSDALDQSQGLPPSASWTIPGLGTVNSMQMNIIKRVQNGEDPLTVGLGEAANTLFDGLFLVGIADTLAGPRSVKVLETKGTLPEGSPQVAPPKTGRLYETPSTTNKGGARVLTPQELTQMQSQGIKMPANFNPAQPVFFRTTLGKGGTYTGEMYQIKPSYLRTAYDSVFGTKTATAPHSSLPALLGAEPTVPRTALVAPEMNAKITAAPDSAVTTLHSQTTSESAIVKATNDAVVKNPAPVAPVVPAMPPPPSTALTVSHNAIRLLGGDTAHATKGVAILEKNIQDGVTTHGPHATVTALVKQLGVDQKTAETLVRETLQKTPVDPHALLAKITGQSVAPPTGPIAGKMEKGDTIALTHIKSGEVTHAIYQGPGNAGLNTSSSHSSGGVMALEPKSGIPMRYPSDRFSVKLVKKAKVLRAGLESPASRKRSTTELSKPKTSVAEQKIRKDLDEAFRKFNKLKKGAIIANPKGIIETPFTVSKDIEKITGAKGDVVFTRASLKHLAEKGIEGERLLEMVPQILKAPDEIRKGPNENRYLISKSVEGLKKGRPQVVNLEVITKEGHIIVTTFQSTHSYLQGFELLWRTAGLGETKTFSPSQQELETPGGSSGLSALREDQKPQGTPEKVPPTEEKSKSLTLRSEEPTKERTQGPGNTQVNVTKINGERVETPTPLVSKSDLKNLINTLPNQEGNFKVALNAEGQMRMNLTTPNGEMSLRPSALGLVESQLKEGDVIHVDSDNLKAKGTSFRVVNKDNKVEASGGGAASAVRMVKPNFSSEMNRGFISADPVIEAAGKMSKFIEETGKKIEVSENLADDLYKLETNNKRDLEIAIQMLLSVDFSPADAEAIYHYEEDKTLPLTEKQQELYDTVIKPLAEKSSEIFSRLQNEGLPMNNEDYTPRFVKGKKSAVERIARALIDGVKNVSAGQGSMLSKTTGAMKKRTMKALVDENGNRTVVSIKGGKVMSIQGKVAVHMGNLARRVAPKVKEFFDPEVRGKLETLAKELGITHERHATGRTAGLGGKRAGVSFQGESLIKTRMSPDSVLAHEIGHQIDHKYGMQAFMAEERYDAEHRTTLAREMRALADARFASKEVTEGFKSYVRKGSEKMAVMFEAYISNKQLFKDVAPHLYDDFRQFLRDHKELSPFLDIKGSVTLDSTVHGGNLLAGRSGNTFVSNTGKTYRIEDATTKEIERDTSVKYHKNVLVNRTLQYLKLRQIDRANEFMESFKNDPGFSDIAVKTGEEAPANFKGTRLPQFRGYLLEPRLAEIFNRLADKMESPDGMYAAMGTLNRVLRNAIFFNPLIHVPNITVHWLVNRGLSKFALPMGYIRGAKAFARAWDAVVHHSDDYLVALEHGAPLLSSDASNKKLAEVLLEKMATDLQSNPDLHSKIATALGYANPANLIKAIYKFSSTVTWGVNDLLTMQAAYEDMATYGWSLDRAIEETGKHIPNYRVPERIFDKALTTVTGEKIGGALSTTAGSAMKNPVVSMFGAYHYGALRSYGEMIDSLMTGNKAGGKEGWKNRAYAADKIAMMGLLGLVLYPYLLDKFARWLTGNKNAQFRRAGSLTFPENITQLISGEKDAGQVFQSVITPAPATKMIAELVPNIDFWSGSKIYGIGGEGFWNFMADQIAPLQQARQVTTGTKSAVSFFASLGGISSPTSTGSEKILQMMIYDEKPKLLKDMKARIAAGDVQGAKDIGHEFNIRLAETIKQSLLENGKSGSDAQIAAVLNINGLRMPGTVAMANYTGNKGKSFIAKLSADGKPTIKTGVAIENDSLVHAVMVYASAIVTDPASAMSDIFQGQTIRKVDNGTVIVYRMSVTDSQAIKTDLGGGKIPVGMTLDHTIPLSLGGTNNESNLKLVPAAEAKAADTVENYLGNALTAGSIDKATAQKLMLNYKSGIMTFDDVKNAIAK